MFEVMYLLFSIVALVLAALFPYNQNCPLPPSNYTTNVVCFHSPNVTRSLLFDPLIAYVDNIVNREEVEAKEINHSLELAYNRSETTITSVTLPHHDRIMACMIDRIAHFATLKVTCGAEGVLAIKHQAERSVQLQHDWTEVKETGKADWRSTFFVALKTNSTEHRIEFPSFSSGWENDAYDWQKEDGRDCRHMEHIDMSIKFDAGHATFWRDADPDNFTSLLSIDSELRMNNGTKVAINIWTG